MGIDIDTFRFTVSGGFQKPDKYRIFIPVPFLMTKLPWYQSLYSTARDLEFYADSVDLIGATLQTVPISRYGYGAAHEYVYGVGFSNIMMTFYNDSQAQNLFYFQQWMNICNNFDMSAGVAGSDVLGINTYESYYRDDYVVDANITLLNSQGLDVATWTMRQSYPKAVPESKLAWSITGDVHRITVIFSYTDWFLNPEAGQQLEITNNAAGVNNNAYIDGISPRRSSLIQAVQVRTGLDQQEVLCRWSRWRTLMFIYQITNQINGKRYIGLTTQTLRRRWNHHKCVLPFIKKYGAENFTIEQIDTASSIEELKQKEIEWIAKLKPEYNQSKGGDGMFGFHQRPETIEKIRAKALGRKRPDMIGNQWAKTQTHS